MHSHRLRHNRILQGRLANRRQQHTIFTGYKTRPRTRTDPSSTAKFVYLTRRNFGLTTGTGQPFHHKIVDNIIHTYRLRSRRQRLRAAGMLTPTEMATLLGISRHTVKAWHRAGIVSGLSYNDKGETLYHHPTPKTQYSHPKSEDRQSAPANPNTKLHTHQPDEVQYATRGLSWGERTRAGSVMKPRDCGVLQPADGKLRVHRVCMGHNRIHIVRDRGP